MTHRQLSQQPDPNRTERPFLYYIPSSQQAPPPKPQPKGNPGSNLSYCDSKLNTGFQYPFTNQHTQIKTAQCFSVSSLATWLLPYLTVCLTDAWHAANTSDPLVDSDEEFADHHARLDYSKIFISGIISIGKLMPISASAERHHEDTRKTTYFPLKGKKKQHKQD